MPTDGSVESKSTPQPRPTFTEVVFYLIGYFSSTEEERAERKAAAISRVCVGSSAAQDVWEMLRWPFAFIIAAAVWIAILAVTLGALYLVVVGILWIWPDGLLTSPISQLSLLDILRGILATLAVAVLVLIAFSRYEG